MYRLISDITFSALSQCNPNLRQPTFFRLCFPSSPIFRQGYAYLNNRPDLKPQFLFLQQILLTAYDPYNMLSDTLPPIGPNFYRDSNLAYPYSSSGSVLATCEIEALRVLFTSQRITVDGMGTCGPIFQRHSFHVTTVNRSTPLVLSIKL